MFPSMLIAFRLHLPRIFNPIPVLLLELAPNPPGINRPLGPKGPAGPVLVEPHHSLFRTG